VSLAEAELAKARVDLLAAKGRDSELSSMFLKNTTKLGAICAAFGITSTLEPSAFVEAVNQRVAEIRGGAKI
jgi:hypothetical protein